MSRRPVGYHPAAFAEAEGAAIWYRERSPQAEAAFLAELERAIREIGAGSERWPPYLRNTRRYLLHRFPFSVVYRERAGKIEIVAVAHAHRRPGYWYRR
ncbi:MAG: type II toxin-antitoxin system RelE/ParE family toxin [Candidatus Polarisedimenticolia bacterium]